MWFSLKFHSQIRQHARYAPQLWIPPSATEIQIEFFEEIDQMKYFFGVIWVGFFDNFHLIEEEKAKVIRSVNNVVNVRLNINQHHEILIYTSAAMTKFLCPCNSS